jgi:hypothetical protein
MSGVTGLNWFAVALMLTVPPAIAVCAAVPCWRHGQMILGNLAGTAVIFAFALALILKEHVELERLTQHCLDGGFVCWPDPSAFSRYAIYAFIGLFEVFALFTASLSVEQRMRTRDRDPEWR